MANVEPSPQACFAARFPATKLLRSWCQPPPQWPSLALLSALVILPACSNVALPTEEMPAAGAEPAYRALVANQLNAALKDRASYDAFEISDLRWVHSFKGWSWLACVHFQDRGQRRTYALFISGNTIVDSRYAVQTDACDVATYSPFDLATGAIRPAGIGEHGPLY
jgi:hypothetical protein